ncbi:MAG: cyclic nucleotide-binding domain-containing protein [Methylococcaceae bacterium]|nr:cyclic nucleotide-binding domain-containing protein [Methylococcaceae bacterium]
MAVDIQSEEGRVIRQLIPLATLPFSRFEALCAQFVVEEAEDGQFLFKRGDSDADLFYLLQGAVLLKTEALNIETITAGSNSARFALAHQIPRKVNAVANGKIRFLRLNADMIKSVQDTPYEESESYMIVDESTDDDDWMTTLLKSPIFRVLPPSNLQKILMGLQEVRFDAGEVIISQGDPGDFYYIIKKGQCLISRKPTPNAKEVRLGQLTDQDTFGEDSLISGEPRNVTITALTDVSLLRLSKEQFVNLIKRPVLKYVSYPEVQELVSKGADLIDVRAPDEYQKNHLARSINLPFFSLRMQLKSLNRHHPIIVVCRNGKASETAAFFLLRHKFNALILKGGMESIEIEVTAPASFVIDDGVETGNYIESVSETGSQPISEPLVAQDDADKLRQIIQGLKAQCSTLQAEKKALEQQCLALVKQIEALKAAKK